MSEPAPWKCPDCKTRLAPHISEHRCEPAATVTPWTPASGSGSGGTYAPAGSTVVVHASGASTPDIAHALNLTARRQVSRYGFRPAV